MDDFFLSGIRDRSIAVSNPGFKYTVSWIDRIARKKNRYGKYTPVPGFTGDLSWKGLSCCRGSKKIKNGFFT
jgi:hypothetical protein